MECHKGGEEDNFQAFPIVDVEAADAKWDKRPYFQCGARGYAPMKVVVKDLNLCVLDLPTLLLRDCDEDWRVWFANKEALFSLPLELVPYGGFIQAIA